jgi:L-threonylcarbamoyladenylate synthase
MKYTIDQINEIADELISGKVGVLPTDTIYGIHASATNFEAIERIYQIKQRDNDKPFIILVNSIDEVGNFEVEITSQVRELLLSKWPGPTTVILPCQNDGFGYLHRGKFSLGFRYPNNQFLNKLLQITGPLVSTSANIFGTQSITNIEEAEKTLQDKLDFYVDGGKIIGAPSEIFKFENNELTKIR